jgi:hypothetical protein
MNTYIRRVAPLLSPASHEQSHVRDAQKRTFVFLLEISSQMSLHECCLAWIARDAQSLLRLTKCYGAMQVDAIAHRRRTSVRDCPSSVAVSVPTNRTRSMSNDHGHKSAISLKKQHFEPPTSLSPKSVPVPPSPTNTILKLGTPSGASCPGRACIRTLSSYTLEKGAHEWCRQEQLQDVPCRHFSSIQRAKLLTSGLECSRSRKDK